MQTITEDDLRDILVDRIDALGTGLTFLAKEKHIPNEIGTRSYIDLLARDSDGRLVLIELKRSGTASREAIHEILKYVEGVKQYLAIREDELRVIVASTEWSELLVPFSRFTKETTIEAQGLKLVLDGSVVRAEKVEAVSVEKGRLIAPWADLRFYQTREALNGGINNVRTRFASTGVQNYVIVVLHNSVPHVSQHQESMYRMFAQFASVQGSSNLQPPELPKYNYCLYVASQMLSEEAYWDLLSKDSALYANTREEAGQYEDDDLLKYLHETLVSSGPTVECGHLEIGYPAKFKDRLQGDEGWTVWGILRFGTFERNPLLTDETIVRELSGSEGHTGQSFQRDFSMLNRSQLASAREGIDRCLETNAIWRHEINLALDEVEKDYPDKNIHLSIFNPSTGLLTIYYALSKEKGLLYIPSYNLAVLDGDKPIRVYAGCLIGKRKPKPLAEILATYYEGEIGALMFSFSWGGYTSSDSAILTDCGIEYTSLKRDLRTDPLQLFIRNQDSWAPTGTFNPFEAVFIGLRQAPDFIKELMDEISSRDHGGIFEW